MLIELTILCAGSTYWFNKIRPRKKLVQLLSDTTQVAEPPHQPSNSFSFVTLLKDIKKSIMTDEREQLQLAIDPRFNETLAKNHQKTRRNLQISLGAIGLALLGSVYSVFTIPSIFAILYLFRGMFKIIWMDLKRGYYLSTLLMSAMILLGLIATGQLVLASLLGLIGGFFAKIINRIESNTQQQLINIFSDHPTQVWLLRNGVEIQLDFEAIQIGDMVIVNAGEVIPVDGVIQSGTAQIDQHILTGESQPVEKCTGDSVFASTLLLSGRISVRVETSGEDSVAAKIGKILDKTQSYKDTQMTRGREIANHFLPVTMGLSVITLPLLGAKSAVAILSAGLGSSMSFLGSMSILSYLQILSRNSILVKDGRVFELLSQVDTVVFDKTGTLTLEQPTLGKIHAFGDYSETTVLRYAASAEYRQPHPVAKAILARAEKEQLQIPESDAASYATGYGIKVTVDGLLIRVGSARFLQREGIEISDTLNPIEKQAEVNGYSLIYVGIDQQLAGIFEIQPTLRPEAKKVIQFLKQRGLKLYIISGDHDEPTRKMAQALGIDDYFSETLPENKAELVNGLRQNGQFVCFIGDGINDAIALKSAQVSISIKGASSAATDTAQIVFMDSTLSHLEQLFHLADKYEDTMKSNLAISIIPGVITIGGVYLLHFGAATGMGLFYFGMIVGLGNVFWPLAKHQDNNCAK